MSCHQVDTTGGKREPPTAPAPNSKKTSTSYRSEVVSFVKESIENMKTMEAERNDIKKKIAGWKRQFEKRYKRPPSDEEKLRNIPELFQRFSYVRNRCTNIFDVVCVCVCVCFLIAMCILYFRLVSD